jgi:FkbM family methyltransferase
MIETALARIGQIIGKPPGWERVVRAIAPPQRYVNDELNLLRQDEGYVFPVDRGTLIGWSVHFFGAYEPEVREEIRRRLRPGDVAIDVGANVGWHTLLMASCVGRGGRVYAFEPNATTRERLQHAIAINQFPQVHVDPRAVAEQVGVQTFEAPAAGAVWDGTGRLTTDRSGQAVTCTTLDAFAAERQIDRVALMKIDVEGWEPAVLRGAARVLRTSRPALIFEYDPAYVGRSGANGADLSAWLGTAGYRLYALRPRGGVARLDVLARTGTNVLAVPNVVPDR